VKGIAAVMWWRHEGMTVAAKVVRVDEVGTRR
jgi:hypothetical protein